MDTVTVYEQWSKEGFQRYVLDSQGRKIILEESPNVQPPFVTLRFVNTELPKALIAGNAGESMSTKIYQAFNPEGCAVQVTEKWGVGWHLKYIQKSNGEVVVLEADGEAPPFVRMAQSEATTAGNAGESR